MAEGTMKNILVQWRAFDEFCYEFHLNEWPTTTDTLCLFAQHLAKRMRSVKVIEAYLYGVVQLHLYAGVKPPDLKHFKVKLTLRGLKRTLKHRVKQPKPLTTDLLLKIKQQLNSKNTEHVVLWAILLTGFFLLLRKSNLVPDKQDTFDPGKQLCKKHIKVTDKVVKVSISWSKTIQFQQKKLKLKMYALKDNPLCPVQAFKRLFLVTNPQPHQSCFLASNGLPFSYNMLNYRIKKYLKLAGVKKYKRYSTHSLQSSGWIVDWI